MAAPVLLMGSPILCLRLHHQRVAVKLLLRRPWSNVATESSTSDDIGSSAGKNTSVSGTKEPPTYPRLNELNYRNWKEKEEEILRDIEPITLLTKEILHSKRYMNGEGLTAEDENAIVDNLLAYHPHSEDKIGCGLNSIMVDRHPQFRHSRYLFVVRSDGGWIDFSYQKCLRAYI